jgi:GT2 family glycosyltransferase
MVRFQVFVTSYNRRKTTIACLASLIEQAARTDRVALFDDGSSDGTPDAVRLAFPDVAQFSGDSDAYWAGAIRYLLGRVERGSTTGLLLLNDDVILDSGGLDVLRDVASKSRDAIVVGCLRNPDTRELAFGPLVAGRVLRLRYRVAPDAGDTFPGNLVYIPWGVFDHVGGFEPAYRHTLIDTDFGFRASSLGYRIVGTRVTIGSCRPGVVQLPTDLTGRWRYFKTNPTAPPNSEWWRQCRTHGGPLWLLLFLYRLRYVVLPTGVRDAQRPPGAFMESRPPAPANVPPDNPVAAEKGTRRG